MTTLLAANKDAPIYPAFYFRASPTYNDWAKLTVRDVHGLRTVPEFEAQSVYFHLNHPIRYVRLIATVVGIEQISKYVILNLDDHSGSTIEAKITRVEPRDIVSRDAQEHPEKYTLQKPKSRRPAYANAESSRLETSALESPYFGDSFWENAIGVNKSSKSRPPTIPEAIQAMTAAGVRETTIGNVEVISTLGTFDVLVDGTTIDVGSVVKAKCTIGRFRNEMQVEIKRIWVIKDTNEEVQAWTDTSKYRQTVLSKPWRLSSRARRKVDEQVKQEQKRQAEYTRKKAEYDRKKKREAEEKERKWATEVRRWEEREELKRREKEKVFNEGALI
ncbi:uncharacterized protein BDZ99DRAFT_474447 [Mytilinidion resinicola]|uniref:CST complex subunit Stn1 N-terminal domain-containing protein n=1 Tax=Mytilinidion resinicola TaxID=574789 RepID=A0A6A6YW77_9PEZI|nr:uncharacterized protein BDZ99DRAFT_474447 [Mytilinidion resinicola]KAF2812244.1 hypothetical protein BDZ99DRAFT_474447 [Mytilinidion resinicola]